MTFLGVSEAFRPLEPDPALAGRRFILAVGQFAPYKNHEVAVRAFALALRDRPEFDLILVQRMGKGTRGLLRLAVELGIGGRVRLLPAIGREELVQLYSSAAALLHPSLCEGFGMPLAEAMACGCPVVASNVSAMPEVTGGAALLANPRDPAAIAGALRKVVDDPALVRDMRRKGLKRAATLSWRAFAEANVALYRNVLASGSPSSSAAI